MMRLTCPLSHGVCFVCGQLLCGFPLLLELVPAGLSDADSDCTLVIPSRIEYLPDRITRWNVVQDRPPPHDDENEEWRPGEMRKRQRDTRCH